MSVQDGSGLAAQPGFADACRLGDGERVLLLLNGSSEEVAVRDINQGFIDACTGGHLAVVGALLQLGGGRQVDVHAKENAGFLRACRHGHVHIVRALLALEGDRSFGAAGELDEGFQVACLAGHVQLLQELLGEGGARRVDVHAEMEFGFRWACEQGHVGVLRELLALEGDRRIDVHVGNDAALVAACQGGHLAVVRLLLELSGEREMDVHTSNGAAFLQACEHGHVDVVRELLALTGDRRVDVHADDEYAFRAASSGGHTAVVRELIALKDGRTVDVLCFSEIGMRSAATGGHVGVLQVLASLGGDRRIGSGMSAERMQRFVMELVLNATQDVQHAQGLAALLRLSELPSAQSVLAAAVNMCRAQLQLGEGGLDTSVLLAKVHNSASAGAAARHVLLHVLDQDMGVRGPCTFTRGVSFPMDALALCMVLPAVPLLLSEVLPMLAACDHILVSEIGKEESIEMEFDEGLDAGGDAPQGQHVDVYTSMQLYCRDAAWGGLAVPVEEAAGLGVAEARLALRRLGRRCLVLSRKSRQLYDC